jgi:hypothetical protein
MKFDYKEYGIILTDSVKHKKAIIAEMRKMDSEEVEYYMPDDIIAIINKDTILEECQLVYVGKFDVINLEELHNRMETKGVPFAILMGRYDREYDVITLSKKSWRTSIRWLFENGFYTRENVHAQYGITYLDWVGAAEGECQ